LLSSAFEPGVERLCTCTEQGRLFHHEICKRDDVQASTYRSTLIISEFEYQGAGLRAGVTMV